MLGLVRRLVNGENSSYSQQLFRKKLTYSYNYLISFLFYYLILTLISLILRLSGRHFLALNSSKKTYWKRKKSDEGWRD